MKRITIILLFAVTGLVACGSPGNRPEVAKPASAPAPTLPDLTNPVVRQRFACSFASGSFGNAFPVQPGGDPLCRRPEVTDR